MLTILSIPARRHNNRYFPLLCEALEGSGLNVIDVQSPAARRFRFDVVHIHFPTHFITQTKTLAAIVWAVSFSLFFLLVKALRKPIIYTVHNVVPFNIHREWLLWPFLNLVHWVCDGFVFLNPSSQNEFYSRFPNQRAKLYTTIAHGPYPTELLPSAIRRQKRRELIGDSDALVIGMLGNVKPYKNVEALTYVPAHLSSGRPVRVIVAGKVEHGYERTAESIFSSVPKDVLVRLDKALSDADLDELVQAVDVVLLPYTRGWNSGAALLVLSNRSRLLGSTLPVFVDLQNAVGKPWVHCFDPAPNGITSSLLRALDEISSTAPTDEDEARLSRFLEESAFANSARDLAGFYRRIVAGSACPPPEAAPASRAGATSS